VPKRAKKRTKNPLPNKSDFLEKSDLSNLCKGFLKPCAQTCQRTKNPLPNKSDFLEKSDLSNLCKNRIYQTVPKVPKKFVVKIGFIKPCAQKCPRNPIFWKNRISQTFVKIGFIKPCAQMCQKNEPKIRNPRNPIFWKNFC
jgi:hypothetical protein